MTRRERIGWVVFCGVFVAQALGAALAILFLGWLDGSVFWAGGLIVAAALVFAAGAWLVRVGDRFDSRVEQGSRAPYKDDGLSAPDGGSDDPPRGPHL